MGDCRRQSLYYRRATCTLEQEIEQNLIKKLTDLKYIYREDIRDRFSLEKNFREKFEELNRVH